jgi:hypothetical protein
MYSNPNRTYLPNPNAGVVQFHLRSLVAQTFSGNSRSFRQFLRIFSLAGFYALKKKIVVRLLNICNGLDRQPSGDRGRLAFSSYAEGEAFKALVEVLRSLGGNVTRVEQPEEPRWKILRGLLGECIELVSGMSW